MNKKMTFTNNNNLTFKSINNNNNNNNNHDLDPLLSYSRGDNTHEILELEIEPLHTSKSSSSSTTPSTHDVSGAMAVSSTSSSASSSYPLWQVISYMLIFFFMMIGHEVALEAASTSFQQLESLASAVTLFQFGFCFFLPLITSTKEVMRTFPKTFKASLPYIQLSILVFGATGLATQSLKYVSYPTKVVFKSAKLIPTMIVSTFVTRTHRTSYRLLDYLGALLLCLGAAGYSFNNSHSNNTEGKQTYMYGITLLLISIVCDALLPNLQQNLMTTHNQHYLLLLPSTISHHEKESNRKESNSGVVVAGLSAQAVMVNTNAIGFGSILIYMILSGSLMDAITTATAEPRLLFYLVCVGVGLSVSVLAYTKLIHASGSVVAVAVSTLRKVVTVLLSYIIFPKPILPLHIFSGALVLIGVLIGTFGRRR